MQTNIFILLESLSPSFNVLYFSCAGSCRCAGSPFGSARALPPVMPGGVASPVVGTGSGGSASVVVAQRLAALSFQMRRLVCFRA